MLGILLKEISGPLNYFLVVSVLVKIFLHIF